MEQSQIGELTYRGTPRIVKPFVEYSIELGNHICQRITEGESLRQICSSDTMPSRMSVTRWLTDYPDFARLYDAAREEAAEAFACDIIELADAECPTDDYGRLDSGFVQRQRLRVDARKWVASKLKPKVWGDKIDIAHSGNVTVTRTCFEPIEGQISDAVVQQLPPKLDTQ